MKRNQNNEGIDTWLDRRNLPDAKGTYPVKIRICRNSKSYLFATDIRATVEMYDAAKHGEKPKGETRQLKVDMNAVVDAAKAAVVKIGVFTTEHFKKEFFKIATEEKKTTVFDVFEMVIAELTAEGRAGTARAYRDALRSLQAFHVGKLIAHRVSGRTGKKRAETKKKPPLIFDAVNMAWLKRYVRDMEAAGNSVTSAAMHLRTLRVVFNRAIREGLTAPESYPFRRQAASVGESFVIPQGSGNKRALTSEQINALITCQDLTTAEQRARDLFVFSMYCNGMNFADLCLLRRSDITKNGNMTIISFYRQKTKLRGKKKQIGIVLPPELWAQVEAIIDQHGAKSGTLVFPYLSSATTPAEEKTAVQFLLRDVNRRLKKVAEKCGIDAPLSTYYARHSFASLLKRSGAPVAMISDALGHSSIATTENYLSGFATEETAAVVSAAFKFTVKP